MKFEKGMVVIFDGQEAEVVAVGTRGWVTIITHAGNQRNVQRKLLERPLAATVSETPESPAPESTGSDAPTDPPATATEDDMAKRKTRGERRGRTSEKARRMIGKSEVKNFDKYVPRKAPSGGTTYDNGDAVAERLRKLTLDEVYSYAADKLGVTKKSLVEKYSHLNPGQQRMCLGNRLRGGARKSKAA